MLNVAVVGAGASGLCCARHLGRYPHQFSITVFEKANKVGGTWVYTDRTDKDEYGLPVHSSMPKALRTNLPKEIMHFPDFPFVEDDLPSFVGHKDVLKYLQLYSENFSLHESIKFRTVVEKIEPRRTSTGISKIAPSGVNDSVVWTVQSKDLETGLITKGNYDYVLVCNGHFFKPYIPDLPGLNNFPGRLRHSHYFRTADGLSGKTLVVVGTRASGIDIMLYAAPIAKEVYLVYHSTMPQYRLPCNVKLVPSITHIEADGVVHFENGEFHLVDELILCTGYQYSYPFLTNDSGIQVKEGGKHVTPLYKHIFNISHPSMVFVGLNYPVLPFPFFDVQIRFIMSVLTGEIQLPSPEDMEHERETRLLNQIKQGSPLRYAHRLENFKVYLKELIQIAYLEPLSPICEAIDKDVREERKYNILNFRKYDYKVSESDPGKVTITKHLRSGETLI